MQIQLELCQAQLCTWGVSKHIHYEFFEKAACRTVCFDRKIKYKIDHEHLYEPKFKVSIRYYLFHKSRFS